MPNIRPIADLGNVSEISKLCHSTNEPVFITQNGYGDMVIMSEKAYDEILASSEIYQKLLISALEIKNGEVENGIEILDKMRKKYGYEV
ncbi:MAG: hypothetical protein PWQ76_846 [Clostridiales bacterium]|jgi:PHD/YefM family antitoxin component YafN of YafNO toxin-antitoxin module|nr:Prevent-host-death family protein [Oscillospiraceae bacterium]MDN5378591.1 hypothetical protein [Clostridiales bacterium]